MELMWVLVLSVVAVTLAQGSPWILVTAPNVLHEGVDTKVYITSSGVKGGTIITLKLGNGQKKTVNANNNVQSTTVKVTKDMIGEPNDQGLHYVTLSATSNKHGLNENQNILVSLKSATVYIQTDKPIYRAEEYARIRIYTVDYNWNSINMEMRLDVKNPDGLVLERTVMSVAKQNNGIHDHAYKLPKFAKPGNWTLIAAYGKNFEANATTTIEVRDYVLPHFEVTIEMDNDFILENKMQISGRVSARHSFYAHLSEARLRLVYRIVDGNEAVMIPGAIQSKMLYAGRALFQLDLSNLRPEFSSLIGKRLQVEAAVTEKSSGIKQTSINRDCAFVTSPYIITFEGTPWNFSPRLTFRFEARIKHINGAPAENVPVRVSAVTEANAPIPNESEVTRSSDEDGRIEHTFNVPGGIQQMKITVTTIKKGEPSSERKFTVNKMNAPGYIHIHSVKGQEHEVDTNSGFTIALTHGSDIRTLYTTVVSGGKIIHSEKIEIGAATITNFDLRITSEMIPSFRLIVWYLTPNNQLVSASRKYVTEKSCRNEVSVGEVGRATPKPDSETELEIQGLGESTVALLAVDKAVYFLKNNDILDRPMFFKRLEANDLGCGTGGGPNSPALFKLSGVALLSNSNSRTTPRTNVACPPRDTQSETSRKRRSPPQTEEIDDAIKDLCCKKGGAYGEGPEPMDNQGLRSAYCASTSARSEMPSQTKWCTNAFYKCCFGNATKVYQDSLPVNARGAGDFDDEDEEDDFIDETEEINPRKNFKETWLFETQTIPANGRLSRRVTLPSSITTWIVHAVSMSPNGGMCVANPHSIRVKKPLFIKLHLPRTAVLGEHLQLKATIYNTMPDTATANIYHVGTSGLCTDAQPGKRKPLERKAKIRSQSSRGVSWLAVPTSLGDIKVKVLVYSSLGTDSVEQILRVVPSGLPEEGKVMIMTQSFANDGAFSETNEEGLDANITVREGIQRNVIKLGLPADAIQEGYGARIELTGNPMIEVVEAKIDQMGIHKNHPRNCGEQTMAKLGQTVYSARYIRDSGLNLMTRDLEVTLRKNIGEGIDIMVNQYRSKGGSFTVWRNTAPMLWLTAFTLKTLHHTKDFSDKMILSPHILSEATNFILGKQDPSGAWVDVGKREYHSDMLGGVGKNQDLMSAYMLLCLLESGSPAESVPIQKGINYLLQNVGPLSSTYKLAQTAYVLALAKHSRAAEVLQWLNDQAQTVGGTVVEQKFWSYGPVPARARNTKSQLELETNGYGLLALVTMNEIEKSAPHVEWLIRQKKSGGLFPSTQAHVVSIQALTEYSIQAPKGNLDIECTFTAGTKRRSYSISEENLALTHRIDVTKYVGSNVFLDCSGTGTALASVKSFYYSNAGAESMCAFDIAVYASPKVTTANPKKDLQNMVLNVCVNIKEDYGKTGMAIIEVGLGTGYNPKEEGLTKLKDDGKISMHEVYDRSIAFYLDTITTDQVCLQFEVVSEVEIDEIRPVPVTVYDYYEPEQKKCTAFYHPHGEEDARISVDCGGDHAKMCECLENNCPTSYGFEDGDTLPLSKNDLNHLACMETAAVRPDYVFKIVIAKEMVRENSVRRARAKILQVFNQGEVTTAEMTNMEIFLTLSEACPAGSPRLELNKKYLVMGKTNNLSKSTKNYYINNFSYVVELFEKEEIREFDGDNRKLAREQKKFLTELNKRGCRETK